MARNSLVADRFVYRNAKLSQRKKLLALHTHRQLVRQGEDGRGTAPPTSLDELSDKEEDSDHMCNNELDNDEDLLIDVRADTVHQNVSPPQLQQGQASLVAVKEGATIELSPTYAGLARIHQMAMKSGVSLSFVDEILGIVKSHEGFEIKDCPLRSTYIKRIRNIDSLNGAEPVLPTRDSVDNGRTTFPNFSILSQLRISSILPCSKNWVTFQCPTRKTHQLCFKSSTAQTKI